MFVRKQTRTRGHVLVTMLAIELARAWEQRRQKAFGTTDQNPHPETLAEALAVLDKLCLLHYQVDESTTVTKLPQANERQTAILKALGVRLPRKPV